MKKKTQNHHLIGDKKPTKIAIDLGGWFRQNWGAQIWIPRSTTNRGISGQRVAGGATRATLIQLRKHGFCRFFMVVLASLRQYIGPGIVPLAPFSWCL